MPETLTHHHLQVFFPQRYGQYQLCSSKHIMPLGCGLSLILQELPPGPCNQSTSLPGVGGLPKKPISPCHSHHFGLQVPEGKDADGQVEHLSFSKCSHHYAGCHLISLCGWGPLSQEAFNTGCPQWLPSDRVVPGGGW